MDHLTKDKRAWNMAQIKSNNTSPEVIVRKYLHSHGFRFRINVKKLPGAPDIVLKKYNAVIFVHGCFWHRHAGCRRCSTPKSNLEYWNKKFERNVKRDIEVKKILHDIGYKVIIIWECQVKNEKKLKELISKLKNNFNRR